MPLRSVFLASAFAISIIPSSFAADVVRPVAPVQPVPVTLPLGLAFATVIDVSAGWRTLESTDDPDNNSHFTAAGNAFVNVPLAAALSAQFDLQGEVYDDKGIEAPHSALMGGAHLSLRNPNAYLLGVFGGLGMPAADNLANDNPGAHSGLGFVGGVEGQLYLSNLTFYGQVGLGDFKVDEDNGPEGFVDGWFARGVARWFITDNLMLQGEFAHGHTDCFIDGECAPAQDAGNFDNWGVKLMARLSPSIYGFLDYQAGRFEATEDADTATDQAFRVGLSFRTGTPSLKANDRFGATLDTPMLPVRAATWTIGLD